MSKIKKRSQFWSWSRLIGPVLAGAAAGLMMSRHPISATVGCVLGMVIVGFYVGFMWVGHHEGY